jgi:hypothetical protein
MDFDWSLFVASLPSLARGAELWTLSLCPD